MLWTRVKQVVTLAEKHYLTGRREKKQNWMMDKIMDLMEERRLWRNCDDESYKSIDRSIRPEIRMAKEHWMEKCRELEELQQRHDTFNLHKRIKDIAKWKDNPDTGVLYDNNNNAVTEMTDKLRIWQTYIELFDDDRIEDHSIGEAETAKHTEGRGGTRHPAGKERESSWTR